mgnify:CR=1 FL=1
MHGVAAIWFFRDGRMCVRTKGERISPEAHAPARAPGQVVAEAHNAGRQVAIQAESRLCAAPNPHVSRMRSDAYAKDTRCC